MPRFVYVIFSVLDRVSQTNVVGLVGRYIWAKFQGPRLGGGRYIGEWALYLGYILGGGSVIFERIGLKARKRIWTDSWAEPASHPPATLPGRGCRISQGGREDRLRDSQRPGGRTKAAKRLVAGYPSPPPF